MKKKSVFLFVYRSHRPAGDVSSSRSALLVIMCGRFQPQTGGVCLQKRLYLRKYSSARWHEGRLQHRSFIIFFLISLSLSTHCTHRVSHRSLIAIAWRYKGSKRRTPARLWRGRHNTKVVRESGFFSELVNVHPRLHHKALPDSTQTARRVSNWLAH